MRSPSLERQLVRGLYEESQGKGYEYIVRDDVIIWNELEYSHNPAKKMRERINGLSGILPCELVAILRDAVLLFGEPSLHIDVHIEALVGMLRVTGL